MSIVSSAAARCPTVLASTVSFQVEKLFERAGDRTALERVPRVDQYGFLRRIDRLGHGMAAAAPLTQWSRGARASMIARSAPLASEDVSALAGMREGLVTLFDSGAPWVVDLQANSLRMMREQEEGYRVPDLYAPTAESWTKTSAVVRLLAQREAQGWQARSEPSEGKVASRFRDELPRLRAGGTQSHSIIPTGADRAALSRLGFDFSTGEERDGCKIGLWEWCERSGIALAPHEEGPWRRIAHSWELANFAVGHDTRKVGEEFLADATVPHLDRLIFWLAPDYPGWDQLFKGDYPSEWDELLPDVRADLVDALALAGAPTTILSSEDAEAGHLRERLNNWCNHIINHYSLVESGAIDPLDADQKGKILTTMKWILDLDAFLLRQKAASTPLYQAFAARLTRDGLPAFDQVRSHIEREFPGRTLIL